jgi:antirestriction protein ArdC
LCLKRLDIRHGGNRADDRFPDDFIQMPARARFMGTETSTATESDYATLLHPLPHLTGCAKRCDREFGKHFDDDAYAVEELVAELEAAFLCADLGITLEPVLTTPPTSTTG